MTTQHTAVQEIALLTKSLRQQVAESRRTQNNNGRRKGGAQSSPRDTQLHDNLLSLLELVDSLDEPAASQPAGSPCPDTAESAPTGLSSEALLDALDQGLAGWHAKITVAYAQGASQELADHLRLAESLMNPLLQREERLEAQRQQLEQGLTEVLHREARTKRQRTVIAQALRAQKAQMLLEIELLRQQRTDQIRQELALEFERAHSHDNRELESARSELESARSELESARCELESVHSELESIRDERESLRSEQESLRSEQETLRSEQESLRDERESLRSELEVTRERLRAAACRDGDRADEQNQLIHELEEQLLQANTELTQLQEQLQSQPETPLLIEAQADTIAELKKQLADSNQQLQDLHQQNSDLAAAVAKHQVLSTGNTPHVSFQQESLSWEERKRLIMQQLEDESGDDEALSDQHVERHLEVEQVLLSTQLEIEKRDREIAELQSIIEQQSDTRQGVAIGAAAFAQAFDNDEVIQQERLKLKEIQREWEEKLRQAEIDVSLERAKLARERSQLESELENTKREKLTVDKEPEKAKKRKWLEHLGLRDENRSTS